MSDEGDIGITINLDGVYYHQAKRLTGAAEIADEEFTKWEQYLAKANAKADRLDDDPSREDELHDLCVEMDRHWQSVDRAATELIHEVAVIHMFCAASLEAHINIRAEQTLTGKSWDEFDKLAIAGKWLFYPRLVSVGSFDPGQKPFQDFQTLIKRRNALMHYKVKRAKVKHGYVLPPLIDQLGLRASAAKESLDAVSAMVRKLAQMEKRKKPDWIANDWCSALDMEF